VNCFDVFFLIIETISSPLLEMFNRCRACLGSSDNMKIVSQDEPEAKQLIAMFTSITNFEVILNFEGFIN
jgi:hypothetical protein